MKKFTLLLLVISLVFMVLSCNNDGGEKDPDLHPSAEINEPENGALFMTDGSDANGDYATLTLKGTAADQEDDDSTLLVEWFSSTDGKLGEGRELTTRVHMTIPCSQQIDITLRVTDSNSNVTEDSIKVSLYYVC